MENLFSKLIFIKENSLDYTICQEIIQKFESDDRKKDGMIGNNKLVMKNVKSSTDLMISNLEDWKKYDAILFESIKTNLIEYFEYIATLGCNIKTNMRDTGYQVQRTSPGEFYTWHHDFCTIDNYGARMLTFIWYLNDIKEKGETEFINGLKIKPETGKLVIFPATWTYYHRGISPKNTNKYICTGWLYEQF